MDKADFTANIVGDIQKERQSASAVMQDFYKKQIFIAGLNADVRVKVMEVTPKLAYDALMVAIDTEMLILDKKDNLKMPIKINAVEAEAECEEEEQEEDKDDAESALAVLNAIRIQKGKAPFKKFPGSYKSLPTKAVNGHQPKTTNGSGEPMKCRYCKKSGHMQKECYKPIKENGAMITAQGKQHKANEINKTTVGAITASGYPTLNSVQAVL